MEHSMEHYSVYLELAHSGLCLAHVPELPGCIVRAPTREDALKQLPDAIRDYHTWLRRHGEVAPPADAPVEIKVMEESVGFGPFERRNAAALFPPDRDSVSPEEIERFFRLLGHTRADLLALARDLPDKLLDWQPNVETFTIRELLRHVGNAEEWYVSRIVPPETLPPEWEHDEDMPTFEFLDMSRRTAIGRLRQLTEAERSEVFYPVGWTDHPEEPWTARKALRRFLEHEWEHTWQVREILNAYRQRLLVRLTTERAGLLSALVGVGETALTEKQDFDEWTAKDVLAHIAAWDRWQHQTMKDIVDGKDPDFSAEQDPDAANAVFVANWRERSLAEVVQELQTARSDWLAWLESLPEEEFFKRRSYSGNDWSFDGQPVRIMWEHDAEHAKEIAARRESEGLKGSSGPKAVFLAALAAARKELLTAVSLVPEDERTTRPVEGEWTIQDVLGHIADWELFSVDGLRRMGADQPPDIERVADIQTWNEAHAEARRDQPWEQVWEDFSRARRELVDALEQMSQAQLARSWSFSWGEGTVYEWAWVYLRHDREHAHGLRKALGSFND
jgi:uncharacterized damage-inducible protein DinB/predicted RNase H-like HicB family nuclease